MKLNKVLLLATAVLMLGTAVAAPVNPKRAARVAQNFYASLSGAKGNATLTATPAEWQYKGIYLFAAAEGGFVLVAADDAVRPILGYSTTGTLDPYTLPPALQQWLHAYQQEIDAVANSQFSVLDSQFSPEWYALENNLMPKDGDTTGVAPLLTTYWDQAYPYNGYCPGNSATGCAATAQAQVMNFWHYPAFGMGSHSYTHASYGVQSADFAHTLYDWDNMPVRATYSTPMVEIEAVATLMYHCGVSLDMQYDPDGSAAAGLAGMEGIPSIDNSLKDYFGYSAEMRVVHRGFYTKDEWRDMLIAELDLGHPIVYTGSGDAGGHGFVCDGYDSRGYMHFNFGWSGRGDGYFPVDSISPGVGGVGGNGTYTFNDNNAALLGLVPDYRMRASDTLFFMSRDGGDDSLLFCINDTVDAPWSLSCNADWITFSENHFDRAGWIFFHVSENNAGQERFAVITFTQGGEQCTVRVAQGFYEEDEMCPLTVVMECNHGQTWQGGAYLSFESAQGFLYGKACLEQGTKDSVDVLVAPHDIRVVWHAGGGTDRYINYTIRNQHGEELVKVQNAYRNGGTNHVEWPCAHVGIEDRSADLSEAVALYPNPVTDLLTVRAEGLQKVELMEMSGRRILSTTQPTIDMRALPAGAYFVRIVTGNNTVVRRIVKQ